MSAGVAFFRPSLSLCQKFESDFPADLPPSKTSFRTTLVVNSNFVYYRYCVGQLLHARYFVTGLWLYDVVRAVQY